MDDRVSVTLDRDGDRIVARWRIKNAPQIFAINQDVKFDGPSFQVEDTIWKITLRPWFTRGTVVHRPGLPWTYKRLACGLRQQDGNNANRRLYFGIDVEILINNETWSRLERLCYITDSQYLFLPLKNLSELRNGNKYPLQSKMTIQITLQKFEYKWSWDSYLTIPESEKPKLSEQKYNGKAEGVNNVQNCSGGYGRDPQGNEEKHNEVDVEEGSNGTEEDNKVQGVDKVKDGSGGPEKDLEEERRKFEAKIEEWLAQKTGMSIINTEDQKSDCQENEKNYTLESNAGDLSSTSIGETDCWECFVETEDEVGYIKRDHFEKEETDSTWNEEKRTAYTKREIKKEEGTDTCATDAKEDLSTNIRDLDDFYGSLRRFYRWAMQKYSLQEKTREKRTDYDEKTTTTSDESNDQNTDNSKSDEPECGEEVTKTGNEEKKATDEVEYESLRKDFEDEEVKDKSTTDGKEDQSIRIIESKETEGEDVRRIRKELEHYNLDEYVVLEYEDIVESCDEKKEENVTYACRVM